MIRLATPADAFQIAAIYRPFCESSHTSFETAAPSAEEMAARVAKTSQRYPWLVEDEAGTIEGYAYASAHRERAAYRWSVDVSVYLRERARGRGLGRALYTALFGVLRRQGFANAFAGVALPNPASVGLHRAMGFKPVGTYERVGFKDGEWRSTEWSQLVLAEPEGAPHEPVPIGEFAGSPGWKEALAQAEALRKSHVPL